MIRAFADASVIYSAVHSATGASRELLRRHRAGLVQLVVSDYALVEAKRNLVKDTPDLAHAIDLFFEIYAFELVAPDLKSIQEAATYTVTKDAPIVAAAKHGLCKYLLTYDRQHLLGIRQVAEKSGLTICTPGDLVQLLGRTE